MNRINIQPEIWEDACCPICTKNVNLEAAEQLLYQAMKMEYGYSDEDIRRFTESDECSREKDRWSERLCKEEEAVIIECGGVYYEDMENDNDNNPLPTVWDSVQQIKAREQSELAEVLRQHGKPTKTGYEYRFQEDSPVIASYSHDEPCDIVILAAALVGENLSLYGIEKDCGYNPRLYDPKDVFAGHLDYVTSEIIYRATKAA